MLRKNKGSKELWHLNLHELFSSLDVSKAKKLVKLRAIYLLYNRCRNCIRNFEVISLPIIVIQGGKMLRKIHNGQDAYI